MMNLNYINWKAMSDTALLKILGKFIRHHRLDQNKTQSQLAEEAGINRTTLSEFEKGKRSNTLTFIQLLRALNQLHLLSEFKVEQQISPLHLAEMEQKLRKRASRAKKNINHPQSDW